MYVPRVRSKEPPTERRAVLWLGIISVLATSCVTAGVSNFRHGSDWSGWLAVIIGLGLYVWSGLYAWSVVARARRGR